MSAVLPLQFEAFMLFRSVPAWIWNAPLVVRVVFEKVARPGPVLIQVPAPDRVFPLWSVQLSPAVAALISTVAEFAMELLKPVVSVSFSVPAETVVSPA